MARHYINDRRSLAGTVTQTAKMKQNAQTARTRKMSALELGCLSVINCNDFVDWSACFVSNLESQRAAVVVV